MRVQDGRIFEAPDGEPDDVTPGGDKEPVVEVLPWWRKRIAALIAAVVVALLAVSAVGYAMSRSNNPGTMPPPPPPPPPGLSVVLDPDVGDGQGEGRRGGSAG